MEEWQTDKWFSGVKGLRRGGPGKEVSVTKKWYMKEAGGDGNVQYLDYIQCQYAGCDILLQFYKTLSLWKLDKGYMESLYYFWQLHVNLQLSKNKKFRLSLIAILLLKLKISLHTESYTNHISLKSLEPQVVVSLPLSDLVQMFLPDLRCHKNSRETH